MTSSMPNSELDEALLDMCADEEVVYHVNQSHILTTTRTESVCVLTHNLVAMSVPCPENRRSKIDALRRYAQSV